MANEFARNIKDAAKIVTKALPAANANNNTDTIDLEGVNGTKPEGIEVEISVPATTTLVDGTAITIKLQDSADNSTFADVDPLIQTTVTGGTGNGSAAKVARFRLPSGVRRYIQFNQAVANGGGDNTGKSVTYSLLF